MKSRSGELRQARPLLGTIVELVADGLGESAARAAMVDAFAVVAEVQRRMSYHDPASLLSRINREAAERTVEVDEWTFEVLTRAAEMHRVSGCVFDVTIAPQLEALGFLPVTGALPSGATFADVTLRPDRTVRFRRPGMRIDLGGIAKGFAVDQAVAALQRSGVPRGLVNAGGDLRAFGDEPFPVGIRHPDDPSATLTTVALQNSALATSAHYFADRLVAGSTAGPIIDPRTGAQARRIRSASVRAGTAMLADALTKVVILAGEAALPALTHFHADAIFIATDAEALCSPGWNATLHLPS